MTENKFKTEAELLKGYGELEKEFTRKCQQLSEAKRELEEYKQTESSFKDGGISAKASPSDAAETAVFCPETTEDFCGINTAASLHDSQSDGRREENMQEYQTLPPTEDSVLHFSSATDALPKVMSGKRGSVSLAEPTRPRTVKEATELAKKLFS